MIETKSMQTVVTLGMGFQLGWQEFLILVICPAVMVGIILLVLHLTGVIGKKK